jgi:hypothetical protein
MNLATDLERAADRLERSQFTQMPDTVELMRMAAKALRQKEK